MNTKIKTNLLMVLLSIVTLAGLHAQETAFTYQGRVTDNGTNFTGPGQFKFALVTSTNANHTATATADAPSNGYITGYQKIDGGNGYVTPPPVTVFGGGGSGATATATISGGVVTAINPSSTGDGNYTSAPTVLIGPPPPDISYTTYWSNDGTSVGGSEPNGAVDVPVADGLFTVVLGDTTQPNMAGIDATLFNQPNLQLRIWFNDGANGFAALNPAQNLTPAPYAVSAGRADRADSLAGLSVRHNTNGAPNIVGGSSVNFASSSIVGATIAGGGATNYNGYSYTNRVTDDFGTVSGGFGNTAGYAAFVGGGFDNTAGNLYATVGGGGGNTASGNAATVGGGGDNIASDWDATVGGGYDNTASGNQATVGGGGNNIASGENATVPGGVGNLASGDYSFAAGLQAQATNDNAFVWSDGTQTEFGSLTSNTFNILAQNGVRLQSDNTNNNGALSVNTGSGTITLRKDGINTPGIDIADLGNNQGILRFRSKIELWPTDDATHAGRLDVRDTNDVATISLDGASGDITCTTLNQTSDRNAKEDFEPVNDNSLLEKIATLPITEWNYKTESATQKHIGPMAQDFHAAFGLNGNDDKHISVIDEGGVALAAIQGLNRKMGKENAALRAENAELKQQLNQLIQTVNTLSQKINGGAQ